MFTKLVGMQFHGHATAQTYSNGTMVVDQNGNLALHDGVTPGGLVLGQNSLTELQTINATLSGTNFVNPRASAFGELPVVARTPVVELASIFPISSYRDVVSLSGSATAIKSPSGSEYVLATTANGTDAAGIVTSERGRYKPGYSANIGVGVRLPSPPTGNQTVMWGAFDGDNGMYFGVDSTSIYVAILTGGVETKFRQSQWNVDPLNGTGTTGLTLDLTRGNIFQVTFSWYGYGVIDFQVMIPDGTGAQRNISVHRFSPMGSTSIGNPNLPVGVQVSNNSTAAPITVYVGGRQYSIVGVYHPNERTTSAITSSRAITTTRTPLLTFQRSSASTSLYIPCRLNGLDCISSADSVIEVIQNGTLTGASYGPIPNISSPETALQVDTSATAISGGSLIYATLVATSGGGKSQSGSTSLGGLSLDVPNTQPLTICVRTLAGTGTTSLVGRMIEDW